VLSSCSNRRWWSLSVARLLSALAPRLAPELRWPSSAGYKIMAAQIARPIMLTGGWAPPGLPFGMVMPNSEVGICHRTSRPLAGICSDLFLQSVIRGRLASSESPP
jgi:hypothetical protein